MKKLIGKTIKGITEPKELKLSNGSYYYDENIVIEFTDGTILKLASWDYEGYKSGIEKEIIIN